MQIRPSFRIHSTTTKKTWADSRHFHWRLLMLFLRWQQKKNCYFQKMLMNCLISVDDDHEVVVVAVCWLHWDVIISTIKRKISLLCHLTILRLSGDTRKKYFSRVWYRLASGRLNPPATQICINQLHLEMALKLFFSTRIFKSEANIFLRLSKKFRQWIGRYEMDRAMSIHRTHN